MSDDDDSDDWKVTMPKAFAAIREDAAELTAALRNAAPALIAALRIVLNDKEGDLDFVQFQVRAALAKETQT